MSRETIVRSVGGTFRSIENAIRETELDISLGDISDDVIHDVEDLDTSLNVEAFTPAEVLEK